MASRLDSERAPALISAPAARSSWRRRCSCAQCRTASRQLQAVHAPHGADAASAWAVDRTARQFCRIGSLIIGGAAPAIAIVRNYFFLELTISSRQSAASRLPRPRSIRQQPLRYSP
jgi:hypothetical protein